MGRHKKRDEEDPEEILVAVRPLIGIEEVLPFKNHENETVKKMAEIIELLLSSPEANMYFSIVMVVNKLAEEIRVFAQGSILTNDKENKKFERIHTVMNSMNDYYNNLATGKKMLIQLGLVEKTEGKDTDLFEERMKRKQNGNTEQGQDQEAAGNGSRSRLS